MTVAASGRMVQVDGGVEDGRACDLSLVVDGVAMRGAPHLLADIDHACRQAPAVGVDEGKLGRVQGRKAGHLAKIVQGHRLRARAAKRAEVVQPAPVVELGPGEGGDRAGARD
jgi:hypothetical protein